MPQSEFFQRLVVLIDLTLLLALRKIWIDIFLDTDLPVLGHATNAMQRWPFDHDFIFFVRPSFIINIHLIKSRRQIDRLIPKSKRIPI